MSKIAALVSGGVDSSVALNLMHKAGHQITAFYLKVWLEDELEYLGQCPWEEDLDYIYKACKELNIPVEVVPLQQEYWQNVIEHSLREIKEGRTPNPDMLCNSRVKFGSFLDQVGTEFESITTGHYANSFVEKEVTYLSRASDPIKDQTYFLAQLSQQQLSRANFPLGNYIKDEIRGLAKKYQLANMNRPDSQGLCFLGKISFRDFVKHHLGEKPGAFIDIETGKQVGQHKGYWFYTIGQRHGLGLSHGPWFVSARDIKNNIIYISNRYYQQDKKRDKLIVGMCNWLSGYKPKSEKLQIKLRHGPKILDCHIVPDDDKIQITLNESDQGIAAGQYAVFYKDEICLGSGMILEDQQEKLPA